MYNRMLFLPCKSSPFARAGDPQNLFPAATLRINFGDEKWEHAMDIWAILSTMPAVPIEQSNPTVFAWELSSTHLRSEPHI